MQQPSFQKWGFARAKRQGPWCLLFLWCAPCWWLGSADRGIFAKGSAKEWAKVKVQFEGSGPVSLAKNCKISNNLSWEGDLVMLAACLQGYEEVIRDNFVWLGRWWMNLYKGSCCSTWVPWTSNMAFAKESRNKSICEEWPFPDKRFCPTIMYTHCIDRWRWGERERGNDFWPTHTHMHINKLYVFTLT